MVSQPNGFDIERRAAFDHAVPETRQTASHPMSVVRGRRQLSTKRMIFTTSLCTGVQRGTPPRASQLIDWAQQGETGTVQIGVARNPPVEHVFGQSLRHLAHNNRRSRVERRSTVWAR